jgi:hypothetical protein
VSSGAGRSRPKSTWYVPNRLTRSAGELATLGRELTHGLLLGVHVVKDGADDHRMVVLDSVRCWLRKFSAIRPFPLKNGHRTCQSKCLAW